MEGVAMNNATGINKLDFLVENLVKKINSKGEINKDEAMIIIDEVLTEGEKVAKKVAEDSAATKDFVRAEISDIKTEIVKSEKRMMLWVVTVAVATSATLFGGFYTIADFMLKSIK